MKNMKLKSNRPAEFSKILRLNVNLDDFKYFKSLFATNLTQDLFEKERIDTISIISSKPDLLINPIFVAEIIYDKIDEKYKDWIIVIAKEPAYNMQAAKNKILIVDISGLVVFIYKAKPLDFPKLEHIEYFPNTQEFSSAIKEKDHKVTIVTDTAKQKYPQVGENIRLWLIKFFVSNEQLYKTNYSEFEQKLLRKLKLALMLETDPYWSLYLASKIDVYAIEDTNNKKSIENDELNKSKLTAVSLVYLMDFTKEEPNHGKKKIFLIQKIGDIERIDKIILNKKREIIGFFAMLLLFLTVIYCPDERQSHKLKPNESIKDAICINKQYLMWVAGGLFFAYVSNKMFSTWKSRKQRKMAFAKSYEKKSE